jgi:hypothetical protein
MLPCIDRARSTEVGRANRRAWWLVPADAVVSACARDTASNPASEAD